MIMQSGHLFPVLQSRRRRGPPSHALELTLNVDARTRLSCMNSSGSLLTLIWGTNQPGSLWRRFPLDQARAGLEGNSAEVPGY